MPDTSIALHWKYQWWPDGVHQEDKCVELHLNGHAVQTVDVQSMLRCQFDRPLCEEISDRIVSMCSELTGKHGSGFTTHD